MPTRRVQSRQTSCTRSTRLQVMVRCSRSAVATLRRRCSRILTRQAGAATSCSTLSCRKASCAAHTRCASVQVLIGRASCAIHTRISRWRCVLTSQARCARPCVAFLSSVPSQARYARSRCVVVIICTALCACTTCRRTSRRVLTRSTRRTRCCLEAVLVLIASFTHLATGVRVRAWCRRIAIVVVLVRRAAQRAC